jgi:hypothetical protein
MNVLVLIAAHDEGLPIQRLVDRAICSKCG